MQQPEQRQYRSPLNQNLSMVGKTISGLNQARAADAPLPPRSHLSPLGQQVKPSSHLTNQNLKGQQQAQYAHLAGPSKQVLQSVDHKSSIASFTYADTQTIDLRISRSPNGGPRPDFSHHQLAASSVNPGNLSPSKPLHHAKPRLGGVHQSSPTTPNFIAPSNMVNSRQQLNAQASN